MCRVTLARAGFFGCIVGVGLLVGRPSTPAARAEPPAEHEVARLVNQLGNADFPSREAASRALQQLGDKSLGALRRAATDSPDAEVRRRASSLVKAITWDLDGGEECCLAHDSGPFGLVPTPDGRRLLSSGGRQLFLWDLDAGTLRRKFTGRGTDPSAELPAGASVALSADGRRVLTLSGPVMRLWELDTGRELRSFTLKKPDHFQSVAFAAGGRQALTADSDRIKLWDLTTGRPVVERRPHQTPIHCAACDREGRRILTSGTGEGVLCLTDLSQNDAGLRLGTGNYRWVLSAAFSADGRRALVGTADVGLEEGELTLWDLDAGAVVRRLAEGRGPIRAVAFFPDGRLALTGGLDKAVRLWDLEAGKELRCFTGHKGSVSCVAFACDGRHGFSVGWDNCIRVWKLPRPRPSKGGGRTPAN